MVILIMNKVEYKTVDTLPPPKANRGPSAPIKLELSLVILFHPDFDRVGEINSCDLNEDKSFSVNRYTPVFTNGAKGAPSPLLDLIISRAPIIVTQLSKYKFCITPPKSLMEVRINGVAVNQATDISLKDANDVMTITISNSIILGLCYLPQNQIQHSSSSLVGLSAPINQARHLIGQYAKTDLPVLLMGETGTGKEFAAHDLHTNSARHSGPFVATNMAALPPDLAVAELFGAKKGAFTGSSHDRIGLFGQASDGILFCDEIGDAPAIIQPMLLRAIETNRIQPLGQDKDSEVNIRIIAATDRKVNDQGNENSFSKPLYNRLSALQITMPSLNSRKIDIPILLMHFCKQNPLWDKETFKVGTRLIIKLMTYSWPGNVRELKNISNQILLGEKPKLDIYTSAPNSSSANSSATSSVKKAYRSHHSVTYQELITALDENAWRIKPAACSLSISRTSCYELIKNCPDIRSLEDIPKQEIKAALQKHPNDIAAMAKQLKVPQSNLKKYTPAQKKSRNIRKSAK